MDDRFSLYHTENAIRGQQRHSWPPRDPATPFASALGMTFNQGPASYRLPSCVVCTEEEAMLIQPCRHCTAAYCTDCVRRMFLAACRDQSAMPPKCCVMLQLRVALPYLSHTEADAYRAKFEEWSSKDKTYCPVPTCSAFIPKRTIPVEVSPPASGFTLAKTTMTPARQGYLSARISSLLSMEEAAGFIAPRTTSRIDPNAPQTEEPPMCLSALAQKLRRGGYPTLPDYSADFHRIIDNATERGGPTATTARTMRRRFLEALQDLPDDEAGSSRLQFPCPACAAQICASCKQRAHPGAPCDTTAAEHELAFLSTFGYKRCPGCGHGVRRMFGCSHMQCICGAHWCWHCARALEDCPGGCGSLEDDDDDKDVEGGDEGGGDEAAATSGGGQEPENLDDRPRRYWERAGVDFGDEPDEPDDFWLEPVNW